MRQLPDGTFSLNLSGLTLESLEKLEKLPVTELKLEKSPQTPSYEWLKSIAKMPLRSLSLHSSHIGDVSFLAETELESLDLSENPISELTPLQGLPLHRLNLSKTSAPDLTPISTCLRLEQIVLPENAKNVETLKSLPSLKRISNKEAYGAPTQSAEEFWAKYAPPTPKAP
jgi:Leucine-rich repeat (LRR) protein